MQNFPEVAPKESLSLYVPRIYGFKIFGKRGSKYAEKEKEVKMISSYGDDKAYEQKDGKILKALKDD